MTTTTESFHIPLSVCEAYEERFVPRLFAPWARHLVEAARIAPGQRVLDVACGTGIVARTAADRMAGRGSVVGVDINEHMLSVARRRRPSLEWQHGDAGSLPFPDEHFDVVLCQSAIMFFPDADRALAEMARVVRRGGVVAIQVWGSLHQQPVYSRLVEVAARHAGPDAIRLLGTYWSTGDTDALARRMSNVGLPVEQVDTRTEIARFESIDELVETEVHSTPLADRLDARAYGRLLADARKELDSFRTPEGEADIPLVGHILAARRL